MGLIFLAYAISAALALCMSLAVARLFRKHIAARRILGITVGVISFIFMMNPVISLLHRCTITTGSDVTPQEAKVYGPPLPNSASHVSYYSDFMGTEAVFEISEDAFREWTNGAGWAQSETRTENVLLPHLRINQTFENGLVASAKFAADGRGVWMLFDREKHRCYYRFSSY